MGSKTDREEDISVRDGDHERVWERRQAKKDQQSKLGGGRETVLGARGRLEIDRSKHGVGRHERRSAESRPLESIWDIRNPNGGESRAEETEAVTKNRVRRENRAICDVEHHDAED